MSDTQHYNESHVVFEQCTSALLHTILSRIQQYSSTNQYYFIEKYQLPEDANPLFINQLLMFNPPNFSTLMTSVGTSKYLYFRFYANRYMYCLLVIAKVVSLMNHYDSSMMMLVSNEFMSSNNTDTEEIDAVSQACVFLNTMGVGDDLEDAYEEYNIDNLIITRPRDQNITVDVVEGIPSETQQQIVQTDEGTQSQVVSTNIENMHKPPLKKQQSRFGLGSRGKNIHMGSMVPSKQIKNRTGSDSEVYVHHKKFSRGKRISVSDVPPAEYSEPHFTDSDADDESVEEVVTADNKNKRVVRRIKKAKIVECAPNNDDGGESENENNPITDSEPRSVKRKRSNSAKSGGSSGSGSNNSSSNSSTSSSSEESDSEFSLTSSSGSSESGSECSVFSDDPDDPTTTTLKRKSERIKLNYTTVLESGELTHVHYFDRDLNPDKKEKNEEITATAKTTNPPESSKDEQVTKKSRNDTKKLSTLKPELTQCKAICQLSQCSRSSIKPSIVKYKMLGCKASEIIDRPQPKLIYTLDSEFSIANDGDIVKVPKRFSTDYESLTSIVNKLVSSGKLKNLVVKKSYFGDFLKREPDLTLWTMHRFNIAPARNFYPLCYGVIPSNVHNHAKRILKTWLSESIERAQALLTEINEKKLNKNKNIYNYADGDLELVVGISYGLCTTDLVGWSSNKERKSCKVFDFILYHLWLFYHIIITDRSGKYTPIRSRLRAFLFISQHIYTMNSKKMSTQMAYALKYYYPEIYQVCALLDMDVKQTASADIIDSKTKTLLYKSTAKNVKPVNTTFKELISNFMYVNSLHHPICKHTVYATLRVLGETKTMLIRSHNEMSLDIDIVPKDQELISRRNINKYLTSFSLKDDNVTLLNHALITEYKLFAYRLTTWGMYTENLVDEKIVCYINKAKLDRYSDDMVSKWFPIDKEIRFNVDRIANLVEDYVYSFSGGKSKFKIDSAVRKTLPLIAYYVIRSMFATITAKSAHELKYLPYKVINQCIIDWETRVGESDLSEFHAVLANDSSDLRDIARKRGVAALDYIPDLMDSSDEEDFTANKKQKVTKYEIYMESDETLDELREELEKLKKEAARFINANPDSTIDYDEDDIKIGKGKARRKNNKPTPRKRVKAENDKESAEKASNKQQPEEKNDTTTTTTEVNDEVIRKKPTSDTNTNDSPPIVEKKSKSKPDKQVVKKKKMTTTKPTKEDEGKVTDYNSDTENEGGRNEPQQPRKKRQPKVEITTDMLFKPIGILGTASNNPAKKKCPFCNVGFGTNVIVVSQTKITYICTCCLNLINSGKFKQITEKEVIYRMGLSVSAPFLFDRYYNFIDFKDLNRKRKRTNYYLPDTTSVLVKGKPIDISHIVGSTIIDDDDDDDNDEKSTTKKSKEEKTTPTKIYGCDVPKKLANYTIPKKPKPTTDGDSINNTTAETEQKGEKLATHDGVSDLKAASTAVGTNNNEDENKKAGNEDGLLEINSSKPPVDEGNQAQQMQCVAAAEGGELTPLTASDNPPPSSTATEHAVANMDINP